MKIMGREIKKRYLILGIIAVPLLARCVQMKAENAQLEKELAASGFKYKSDMDSVRELGFKTKKDYDEFISKSPIPSADGERAVQCAAIAEFWEGRDLSAKNNMGALRPKTIRSVLESNVVQDYVTKQTPYKVVNDRKNYLIQQYEVVFNKDGASPKLADEYRACHAKYAEFVLAKCGPSGICEEKKPESQQTAAAPPPAPSGASVQNNTMPQTQAALGSPQQIYDAILSSSEKWIKNPREITNPTANNIYAMSGCFMATKIYAEWMLPDLGERNLVSKGLPSQQVADDTLQKAARIIEDQIEKFGNKEGYYAKAQSFGEDLQKYFFLSTGGKNMVPNNKTILPWVLNCRGMISLAIKYSQ